MIDGEVYCSCWMDTKEHLRRRREQYRFQSNRETPKEAKRRRHRNWEYLQCWRAAVTAEQRRLERTRNIQVNMSTWDLVCIGIHSLTWMSYLFWQTLLEYHWDYLLHFKQQQRRYYTLACFVIDKSWGCQWWWRHKWMGQEKHVGRWWPGMTMNIALPQMMSWWLTHYICELHHCYIVLH